MACNSHIFHQEPAIEDPILKLVDMARSMISEAFKESDEDLGPSWSWVFSLILKTCRAYTTGVTSAILLSDVFQAWCEQHKAESSRRRLKCKIDNKKQRKRSRNSNTVTIDSIYEKKFLSIEGVLEVAILDAFSLPGTNIHMLSLGDVWSSSTIDLYLHRKYYDLVDPEYGVLKKGRELFVTGCYLRSTAEGSGHPRLLPTEYLVILLDEDQDEDMMLLGAQFCSDSFSSISFEAFKNCADYSLYARIESIGPLEILGAYGCLRRKQITLVDSDGNKLEFLLWGDQVLLANLFSVGSTLALHRPFIANALDSRIDTSAEICLEYGSATQLYLMPFIQPKEQVLVASSQSRLSDSRLMNGTSQSQTFKVSQVTLPCDSHGSLDFSNYPFRLCVADLKERMTNISLYGYVTNIRQELNGEDIIFSMNINDHTGTIAAKLHLIGSQSFGQLSNGHMVFISGLSCSRTAQELLEVSWFEKDCRASLVNLSCLPALLNSPCLHKLSILSDLADRPDMMHVCKVQFNQIDLHAKAKFSHSLCGHFVNEELDGSPICSFCLCSCSSKSLVFHLKVTLKDKSAKVFAQCSSQTATDLLQISPSEFYELPDDEQAMCLFGLQTETFIVILVNSWGRSSDTVHDRNQEGHVTWEIASALKCESDIT
ncbi:uncharacterized protein LOC18430249 isoform X1 [Amborella trichopoda]|uniref:Uncharacterized protein n=1 Tax=Amborella trichopoda TaxID=13333 RepID=W1P3I6_AMBTC|nr:uncharacterized protein LOC18430249 isoform X1 [Amborella trichopoda]ERN02146.1 hypothetical protein AMTR_s00045p00182410 [Amborella trichopoda]|eukprot:XP_020520574.1 uncharacterized protein LOC18430249 isoform X1 [Amborella trichopoda]